MLPSRRDEVTTANAAGASPSVALTVPCPVSSGSAVDGRFVDEHAAGFDFVCHGCAAGDRKFAPNRAFAGIHQYVVHMLPGAGWVSTGSTLR